MRGWWFVLFFAFAIAHADLQPQDLRVWRRAETLADGQQFWSFQSSYQNTSQHYGAGGQSEPLGAGLSRTMSWKQLLASNPQARSSMLRTLQSRGVNENDVAASTAYDVSREEIGFGLNWAYGLNSKWTIGFEIPTVLRSTRVTQNINVAAGASALDTRAVKAMASAQLASSGFAPVPPQHQNFALGDISLISRIALVSSYSFNWSVQQLLRVPTAQNPSVSDYIDDSRSEGPVNLGASSLLDYRYRRWLLGGRVGYTAQLPDQVRMRLGDGPEVDPTVSRQLGDYVWTAVDAEYRATERLSVTLGYSFLDKARDQYSSGSDPNFDYYQLGNETDQQLQQSRVGLFYAMNGRTTERWLLGLDYTYPWIGRNATEAARTSLELTNYF